MDTFSGPSAEWNILFSGPSAEWNGYFSQVPLLNEIPFFGMDKCMLSSVEGLKGFQNIYLIPLSLIY
jgi:hypothetical protein